MRLQVFGDEFKQLLLLSPVVVDALLVELVVILHPEHFFEEERLVLDRFHLSADALTFFKLFQDFILEGLTV